MDRALHHPEKGYYAQNVRQIGLRGDFTTAPQLSEAPAKAIATWVAEAMRRNRTNKLIEIGPGNGTLAIKILNYLPLFTRLRTQLHLVDSSTSLSLLQQKNLGKKARYHNSIHDALAACSGSAIIYSNELVDAFPARAFQKTELGWQEMALDRQESTLRISLLPPEDLPQSSIFEQAMQIGQRIEVHESYRRWLHSWLPFWKCGEMLTVDYGATSDALYTRRPRGSLRAYFHHNLLEDLAVFGNPGRQDITADVNFTDLSRWGDPWLVTSAQDQFSKLIEPYISQDDHRLLTATDHFQYITQRVAN